jgi:hypothetical protein
MVICRNYIKSLQGLPDFKVWLNKERHMFLGWSILKKNSKLIKLGKGSSTSHPGQGLFRHRGLASSMMWLVLILSTSATWMVSHEYPKEWATNQAIFQVKSHLVSKGAPFVTYL